MSTGGQKRTRSERVAALELPPGQWERAWSGLRRRDVLARIALALLAATAMAVVIRAWEPPLALRSGDRPVRSIVARVPFTRVDQEATRQRARAEVCYVYMQDPAPLTQLRALMRNTVSELSAAASLKDLDPTLREDFGFPQPDSESSTAPDSNPAEPSPASKPTPSDDPSESGVGAGNGPADVSRLSVEGSSAGGDKTEPDQESRSAGGPRRETPRVEPTTETPAASRPNELSQAEREYEVFRAAFSGAENIERLDQALDAVFGPLEQRGVLQKLPQEPGRGNQEEILVYLKGKPDALRPVRVVEVLLGDGTAVRETLRAYFTPREVADRLFAWLLPRLQKIETLALDAPQTERAIQEALERAEPELVKYQAGQTLVEAGTELGPEQIRLLELEHAAWLASLPAGVKAVRMAVVVGMTFALWILCGVYMRYRQRGPLASATRLTVLLLLAIVVVAVARTASVDPWRGELVPLMLFGMTVAIVYRQELSLVLSGILALLIVVALGFGLPEFLLLAAAATVGDLSVGRIRSRAKLIYVGLGAGAVAVVVYVGLAILDNQPPSVRLLWEAARQGLWALAAGFIMTGLLPFVERLFGVLTDLSLLELGDVSHPLLQELVRRAPSTYNHSVTVGTIAEAAAESIGARGLLVRVGAYFHDIGKMLKPTYFVENQGSDPSRHDSLVPAMSTLVIIAHIKDGADLARQHRLPQPITDLIAQHHGTTLVEYFYGRAHERKRSDPNGAEIDEASYRYPGPKPQTKEAAVLMLADAVESASRSLVDPTPARIESLVRDIAERRLHDGQFDESGLTLRELRAIERSMVVSLISIYHGRIKYPEVQKTA